MDLPRTDDVIPPTQYAASVGDNGAANITIPIWSPSGRAGIQPNLSLAYSSLGGNGLAGLGFQLTGLSVIERCWRTYATDGSLSETAIPETYCLDGRRLVGAGSEFYPEGDPSTRVTVFGASEVDRYFRVDAANGRRSFYGSRFSDSSATVIGTYPVPTPREPGSDIADITWTGPRAVQWWLDKVEDRDGNSMHINYQRPAWTASDAREVVPVSIYYTYNDAVGLGASRRVTFEYEERNDKSLRRIAQVPIWSSSRLRAIKVASDLNLSSDATTASSMSTVREYELTYSPPTARTKDRLKSVKECYWRHLGGASSKSCAAPVEFRWKGTNTPQMPAFNTQSFTAVGGLSKGLQIALPDVWDAVTGDFNGDGFDDYLFRVPNNIQQVNLEGFARVDRVFAEWKLSLGSTGGLTAPTSVSLPGSFGSASYLTPQVLDLDSDGDDEVVIIEDARYPQAPVESLTYGIFQFSAGNFVPLVQGAGNVLSTSLSPDRPARSASLTLGDIDGDGVTDVLSVDPPLGQNSTASLWLRRGSLSGGAYTLAAAQGIATPPLRAPLRGQEKYLLDLNGDGRLELVSRVDAQEQSSWSSVDNGLAATLFSAQLSGPAAQSFESRDTFIPARDLSTSHLAAEEQGLSCSSPTRSDFLTRVFVDVDGDGLRDTAMFPMRERDRCASVRTWTDTAFVSRNLGGVFGTAFSWHPADDGTALPVLRVGPSLLDEWGPTREWFDADDPPETPEGGITPCATYEDRIASTSRAVDNGLRVVDFDGDGRQDLLLVGHLASGLASGPAGVAPRSMAVALSNGTEFNPFTGTGLQAAPPLGPNELSGGVPTCSGLYRGSGPRTARLGDFNGDGLFDIAFLGAQLGGAQIVTHTQVTRAPDVIDNVSAGIHVASADFTYSYLGPAAPTTVQIRPDEQWEPQGPTEACPSSPNLRCGRKYGYVVSRFDPHAAKGVDEYRYGTPLFDTRGRGFLGFTRRSTTNLGLMTRTSTSFVKQSLPSGGHVYESIVKNQTLASSSSSQFESQQIATVDLVGGVAGYQRASSSSSGEVRENGVVSRKTEEVRVFDEFGFVNRTESRWRDRFDQLVSEHVVELTDPYDSTFYWLLGRYQQRSETSTEHVVSGVESVTRTTRYTYYNSHPGVQTVETEPGGAPESSNTSGTWRFTTYNYDAVGNVYEVRTQSASETRLTEFGYDALSRQYVTSATNSLGHEGRYFWHLGYDVLFAADDANGVREKYAFDAFLRPVEQKSGLLAADDVSQRGDTVRFWYQKLSDGYLNEKPEYYFSASSTATGYFGQMRLPSGLIDSEGGFDTRTYGYDALGRITAVSLPPASAQSTPLHVTREYDRLGRPLWEELPGESISAPRLRRTWNYESNEVTFIDERGVKTTQRVDAKGRLRELTVTDASGMKSVSTNYDYTAFDQLSAVTQPALDVPMTPTPASGLRPVTVIQYDVLGRVRRVDDPDLGFEERLYTSFGDVKRITEPNGETNISVDALGRPVSIITESSVAYPDVRDGYVQRTTYVWDDAQNGIGQLAAGLSVNGVLTRFEYDSFAARSRAAWGESAQCDPWRLSSCVFDSPPHEFHYGYDSAGRLQQLHYPSPVSTRPFAIKYDYGANFGNVESIWDVSGQISGGQPMKLLWHLVNRHRSGAVEEQQFGNGLIGERRFDGAGHLRYIGTKRAGAQSHVQPLQALSYGWEGQFIARKSDLTLNAEETYEHDYLGRLSRWSVYQNCQDADWRYHYDSWGNLRRRERVLGPGQDVTSAFTAGADIDFPHSVKQLTDEHGTSIYGHLPGGQVSRVRDVTINWSPIGLPTSVQSGWSQANYEYDAFGGRYATTLDDSASGISRTVTIGDLYELNAGVEGYANYLVMGPEGAVANVRRPFANLTQEEVTYLHTDHLGTSDAVTDSSGDVVERIKHDPFGERRHPWALAHPMTDSLLRNPLLGFTGHRAADGFGITNMRGRIYDSASASFLSADPLPTFEPHAPGRMSYVGNSPVMLIDPSGYQVAEVRTGGGNEEQPSEEDSRKRSVIDKILATLRGEDSPEEPKPVAAKPIPSESSDELGVAEAREIRGLQAAPVKRVFTDGKPIAEAAITALPVFAVYTAATGNQATGGHDNVSGSERVIAGVGILASLSKIWKGFSMGAKEYKAARTAERVPEVALDNNAIVAAVVNGRSAEVLKGRAPVVSITAAKEFIRGPGPRADQLREFLARNGGRIGAAAPESVVDALQSAAARLGRVIQRSDARVAGSAVREGLPLSTNDKRLYKFLNAIGVTNEQL